MKPVEAILADLVSFPVIGGYSNLSIIEYIKSYLDDFNVKYHLVPNEEGNKSSLHCRIGPPVDDGVILSGHTDVVPVEGQDWTTEPFTLTEKDGKLYARGSADMKGFIACCLAAVPDLIKFSLKKPIYFAFSYDEEVGCLAGPALVQAINDDYQEKPKYAIIGEPSMMLPVVGQKGICVFRTTVHGSAGHSSRIKDEVSAIHEAARLVLWLEQKMNDFFTSGQVDNRFNPNHTSIHIGIFNGGIAHNVIADECSFLWDVRNIPLHRIEDIRQQFDQHVEERLKELRLKFPGVKITTVQPRPIVPALNTPNHLSVVDFIKRMSGNETLDAVSYAAEAGQFALGGFETVICGPGDIAQAHRANEFISKDQLAKGLEMILRIGKTLSKP